MYPETSAEPDDDPAFLACADRIISNLIERHAPEDIHIVRIANWFDHKWLRFSGIGRVAVHGLPVTHTRLAAFTQDQITFPPFTPNRVVTQHCFSRTTRGHFEEQVPIRRIHPTPREHSSWNLHRRVADFSQSAIFLWFSSHSTSNGRGSVMVYVAGTLGVNGWYAGFRHDGAWRLGRVKGASRPEVESYLGVLPPG